MLDSLDEFIEAYKDAEASFKASRQRIYEAGDLYCPRCGGPRRVAVVVRTWRGELYNATSKDVQGYAGAVSPLVATLSCVQCKMLFTALVFRGPQAFELAVFPSVLGGLSTPHTPPGVAYYLDQAQRSQSAGGQSAAVAMYRASLEHLLFEQGYTVKMLGPKIAALEAAIADGSAPRWALDLDPRFLKVLNRLANAAIHPGDGNVARQEKFDGALLQQVKLTLTELLVLVYERDHESRDRLEALEAALADIEAPVATDAQPRNDG